MSDPDLPDAAFEASVRAFLAPHMTGELDHLLMILEGAMYIDDLRAALTVAYRAGADDARRQIAEDIEADCRERHNRPDGDPCVDEDCDRHAAIARGRGEP